MIRTTTPTHTFSLPGQASEFSAIQITYTQNGRIVLEKIKSDLTITGNVVSFVMTQKETNLFRPGECKVQVRLLTTGGSAMASTIIKFPIENVLHDNILTSGGN